MSSVTSLMAWVATYLIHSSLLLGGVWLWFRWRAPASHALQETVWKLAAAGGFVTAALQLGLAIQSPVTTAVQTAWQELRAAQRPVEPGVLQGTESTRQSDHQPSIAVAGERRLTKGFRRPTFDEPERAQLAVFRPDADEFFTQRVTDFSGATESSSSPAVATENASHSKQIPEAASLDEASGFIATRMVMLAAWLEQASDLLTALAFMALSVWTASGMLRLALELIQFRRYLAMCERLTAGPARDILNELVASAGITRKVDLLLADDDWEPGACGWRQWRIIVPERAVAELPAGELRALLAHELAHLVRGDQIWLTLGRVLVTCFGWQPMNRLACREWKQASEYQCDAWAVSRQVERIWLARCLTTVAEWRLAGLATIAGLGSGQRSHLVGRVETLVAERSLVDPWQRWIPRKCVQLAGGLVAFVMVGWAPVVGLPAAPVAEHVTEMAARRDLAAITDEMTSDLTADQAPSTQLVRLDDAWTAGDRLQWLQDFRLAVSRLEPVTCIIQIEFVPVVQPPIAIELGEFESELRALEQLLLHWRDVAQQRRLQTQDWAAERPEMVLIAL